MLFRSVCTSPGRANPLPQGPSAHGTSVPGCGLVRPFGHDHWAFLRRPGKEEGSTRPASVVAMGQARGSRARPHLRGNNLAVAWGQTAGRHPGATVHCLQAGLVALGGRRPLTGPWGGLQPHPVQTRMHSAVPGRHLAPRGPAWALGGGGGGACRTPGSSHPGLTWPCLALGISLGPGWGLAAPTALCPPPGPAHCPAPTGSSPTRRRPAPCGQPCPFWPRRPPRPTHVNTKNRVLEPTSSAAAVATGMYLAGLRRVPGLRGILGAAPPHPSPGPGGRGRQDGQDPAAAAAQEEIPPRGRGGAAAC